MSIVTKYGQITTGHFENYKRSIVNRIYAILPMKEEGIATTSEYIESLNRELIKTIDIFNNCERVISVVCLLENLINETDHDLYRKEVLHCCNIISKLGDSNV